MLKSITAFTLFCSLSCSTMMAHAAEMTFEQYSKVCESLTAKIPPLDYRKGVEVPITVNGKVPENYQNKMDCDKPSLLIEPYGDGQCIPYSRVQLLRDDKDVQMVALFRMKYIRPASESYRFDEIDLILHSVKSGATCFFQALPKKHKETDKEKHKKYPTRNDWIDGNNVPSPTSPKGPAFWQSLAKVKAVGCGNCHDNDPFYYSPYIAQVIDHVPANPLGNYYFDIGPFKDWQKLQSVSTRGNTCTGCHRIGNYHTCSFGLAQATGVHGTQPNADQWALSYPNSHWMPPGNIWTKEQWDVIYKQSVQDLKNCCRTADPTMCIKQPIPRN